MVTNHESQTFTSVFKSHNQHVNYRFLILFLRKEKSAKRVPEKQLKSGEKKKLDRNSSFSFDAFIFFIYLPEVSKLKIRGK